MHTLKDKSGWYRLDAVAAVTPQEVRAFHDAQGKSAVHQPNFVPPVIRTVAVLHMATGTAHITDTEYTVVVGLVEPVELTPHPVETLPATTGGQS